MHVIDVKEQVSVIGLTNYSQVNTNQATIWENKEHLFVRSVKLEDARIVFLWVTFIVIEN